MSTSAAIIGLGYHVPDRILSNHDLEKMVDTSDEWITTRTGIRERRIAAPGECTSMLAEKAARMALDDAGLTAEDLTHVFVATCTPDSYCPSTACWLVERLGIKGRMAMDVCAACSGFLYTLQTARAIIALDPSARVLVTGAEVLTSRVNWQDRSTCILFGDGAGAAILASAEEFPDAPLVRDVRVGSDGAYARLLTILGGASMHPMQQGDTPDEQFFIQMEGNEVFKKAVRTLENACRDVLEGNGLELSQVTKLVPHQANLRIIEALAKRLGLTNKDMYINLDKYGNTSAASVPIALAEAWHNGFLHRGDKVLSATFGGGFTWGAALLEL